MYTYIFYLLHSTTFNVFNQVFIIGHTVLLLDNCAWKGARLWSETGPVGTKKKLDGGLLSFAVKMPLNGSIYQVYSTHVHRLISHHQIEVPWLGIWRAQLTICLLFELYKAGSDDDSFRNQNDAQR